MPHLVAAVRQALLYTLWADRLCLTVLEAVSPEDLVRDTGTSFGSLRGTLVHMLGAQRLWLARFAGQTLDRVPGVDDLPDWEALSSAWAETSAELGIFLAALTPDQVTADLAWTDSDGRTRTLPLWQPVLHLVNHSSYHRGQVVSLLRQMGYEPPATTDMIDFLLDQAPPAWSP